MTVPKTDLTPVTIEPKRVTAVVKLPMQNVKHMSYDRENLEKSWNYIEPTPEDKRMTLL